MAFFKKQNSEKKPSEANNSLSADLELSKLVHVMPQRYYFAPKKNNAAAILIVIIGILIIAVLSVAAFYLSENLKNAKNAKPQVNPEPVVNQNTNANANVNTNIDTNVQATAPTSTQPETNTNIDVTNQPTNPPVATTSPAMPNTNPAPVVDNNLVQPPVSAADADNDLLTAAEEKMYNTNVNNADSDADGFTDGNEILSGYDPSKANKKLAGSGLFIDYKNSYFSIMYPKDWRQKVSDQTGTEVLFISPIGEFVEVLAIDNPEKSDLNTWLKSQYGEALPQVTDITLGKLVGVRESDNLKYYFIKDDKSRVYLLTYNIGNAKESNFMTTFTAMVKSFKPL